MRYWIGALVAVALLLAWYAASARSGRTPVDREGGAGARPLSAAPRTEEPYRSPVRDVDVVDSKGHPVAGAVLERWDEDNGRFLPVARSNDDGLLVLPDDVVLLWGGGCQIRADGYALWAPAADGERRVVLQPAGKLRIEFHDENDQPVAGVRVHSRQATSIADSGALGVAFDPPEIRDVLVTDARGVVEFDHAALPARWIEICPRKEGYAGPETVTFACQSSPSVHRIQLTRGGRVRGRVLAHDGVPVEGAQVEVNLQRTRTNAGGYFEIDGVLGYLELVARHPVGGACVETFRGLDESERAAEGSVRDLGDIRMSPPLRVTFRLPESTREVRATLDGDWIYEQERRFAGAGPHSFAVCGVRFAGWVRVGIEGHAFGRAEVARRAECEPADLDFGLISPNPGAGVEGRILDEEGRPVPFGVVKIGAARAAVDAEGYFATHLRGDPPFVPLYFAPGEWKPSAIGRAFESAPEGAITLTVRERGSIEIVVRATEEEWEGIELGIVPAGFQSMPRDWYQGHDSSRDDDGTTWWIRSRDIPAGTYDVGVIGRSDGRLDSRPAPVRVVVDPGRTARVELTPPRPGAVTVQVESAAGHEVTDLQGRLIPAGPSGGLYTLMESVSPGALSATCPGDGTWIVWLRAPAHAPWVSEPLVLRRREQLELGTIRLEAGRAVSVRVLDATGNGIPGAWSQAFELPLSRYRNVDPQLGRPSLRFVPNREMAILTDALGYAPATTRIPATGDQALEVRLTKGAPARVRIFRPDGNPARSIGVDLVVMTRREQLPVAFGTPDPQGYVSFDALPVGEPLEVFARHRDERWLTDTQALRFDGGTELRFRRVTR